ncbi:ABC transporter ATP-binding protein [Portibacter lacus]|uniref:ABC transporter ATP-binding protein n=1 Tax=Portibacter lacus TaxID=1099794 RepID=A0AA37SQ72_9BACT|nr:ATP-binding cassette domain-containing protein [Portibacter lacus]GLR17647.1 ABC transporter ATP-binding protein [Portibacter lacus]
MNILSIQDVVKRYHNHTAVDHVSFDIPKGKIFGLLGPNGAGKTSLIRIITTITRPDSGQVLLDGAPLSKRTPEEIGYMPEERGLYKKMKVGEHLKYLGRLKGLSEKEVKTKMDYWMERFEITNWYKKKIEELSKGMQQKIQFIATVLHDPKLLILDEPFSGLDPVNTNLIKDEIDRLNKQGTSIIFSTHRMEQVEEICERIVLINQGKKILEGQVSDIKNQFKENLYKIKFDGEISQEVAQRYQMVADRDGHLFSLNEGQTSNDLLRELLAANITIHAFEEKLPSVNEIFINLVNESKLQTNG